jgi:hypothetical protein
VAGSQVDRRSREGYWYHETSKKTQTEEHKRLIENERKEEAYPGGIYIWSVEVRQRMSIMTSTGFEGGWMAIIQRSGQGGTRLGLQPPRQHGGSHSSRQVPRSHGRESIDSLVRRAAAERTANGGGTRTLSLDAAI